jgi:MFS transporter, DHA1 family, multidrug resistance protein
MRTQTSHISSPPLGPVVTRRQHLIRLFAIGFLTAIGPFSIDMYLPGFPAIARDLNVDLAHVALSLTSYFIGISLGQLAYGPLLDRYGRRTPVIAGLLIYIAAATGCSLSPSLAWLVGQRFLLALGGCVGIVASRTIVRDLFPVNEIARIFSLLMLVLGVSPIIAPSLGAYVADTFGWRYIFVILALIAALILWSVIRYLPESRPGDPAISLRASHVFRTYAGVLKDPAFMPFAVASAMASAGLFSYISDSPFLFTSLFHLSDREFGLVFSLSACGIIGASQVNRFALKKRDSRAIALIAALVQSAVGLCFIGAVITGAPLPVFLALVVSYLICLGFLSPNTTALALEPFSRHAGSASALLGSMQMAAGALASAIVSYAHNGTAMPMALLLCGSATVSLALQLSPLTRRREPSPEAY